MQNKELLGTLALLSMNATSTQSERQFKMGSYGDKLQYTPKICHMVMYY